MTAADELTAQRPISVVLGAAPPLLLAALEHAFAGHPDVNVVAGTKDSSVTVAETRDQIPDVAVLLYGEGEGIDACAEIKKLQNATRVLVVGTVQGPEELVVAVEAGADGYVAVDSAFADVVEAVRSLAAGEAWIPSAMLGSLLGSLIRRRRLEQAALARFNRLSVREREVIGLLVEGLEPQAIADALFVSRNTVRTHVQNVLQKLEVHSRLEAVRVAMETGAFDHAARKKNDER